MPLKINTLTTLQNAEKEYVKAHPTLKAKKGCKESVFYTYNVVLSGNARIVLGGQCQEKRLSTILDQQLFCQNIQLLDSPACSSC